MSRAARAIGWGGLIAGTLDIADAFLFNGLRSGVRPERILQYIASGLLGARSFSGGWRAAALGLALHFVIAFAAATAFWLASRRLSWLVRHYLAAGLLFGGVWYLFMNRVVVPLSSVARSQTAPPWINLVNGVLAIMILVGLPIAIAARRYSRSR
jgi:hypothetical protein